MHSYLALAYYAHSFVIGEICPQSIRNTNNHFSLRFSTGTGLSHSCKRFQVTKRKVSISTLSIFNSSTSKTGIGGFRDEISDVANFVQVGKVGVNSSIVQQLPNVSKIRYALLEKK